MEFPVVMSNIGQTYPFVQFSDLLIYSSKLKCKIESASGVDILTLVLFVVFFDNRDKSTDICGKAVGQTN